MNQLKRDATEYLQFCNTRVKILRDVLENRKIARYIFVGANDAQIEDVARDTSPGEESCERQFSWSRITASTRLVDTITETLSTLYTVERVLPSVFGVSGARC